MRTLDAERELLAASLAAASRDVLGEETSDPQKARELLEQGPGAADEDPMPRVDAFDVMVQLSKAVPEEITHDVLELDVNRGHVTLQGVVPSVSDAQIDRRSPEGAPLLPRREGRPHQPVHRGQARSTSSSSSSSARTRRRRRRRPAPTRRRAPRPARRRSRRDRDDAPRALRQAGAARAPAPHHPPRMSWW